MNTRSTTIALAALVTAMTAVGCRNDSDATQADETTGAGTDASSTGGGGATTNNSTSGADDTSSTGDTSEPDTYLPAPGGLRRLLAHQYVASIEHLLGPDAAAAAIPPLDQSLGGFDAIAAAELSLSPMDVEQYERSANAIAFAVLGAPETLASTVPCIVDEVPNDACFTTLARDFGRLAWRRPLTEEELQIYAGVGVDARAFDGGEFWTGVQFMLVALLQSPRFLYMVEIGEPADDGLARELNPYELASRMSFFLIGRTPDAALLDRAAAGTLGSDDEIRDAAWSLLEQPGAREVVARFYDEFLTIRDLAHKGKDPVLFPQFTPELATAMREETQRLIAAIVFDQDSDVLELFDADYTFVDESLATLYGVASPGEGQWASVSLPDEQHRAGVLTHASVLAMMSHGSLNSPTRRGLFVQEQLLCTDIPPTPPDVNPTLPDVSEPMSLRQRLEEVHLSVASCAGCHLAMDPIGFAFENFDPIGAYRTEDNGFPINSAGEVEGIGEFAHAADLAALVSADPRLPQCLVNQVYTSALGFTYAPEQESPLADLNDTFASSDHNMRALLVELTTSPIFRRVDEPK